MTREPRAGNHGLGPVSIVVCNYNGERYLEDCLTAALALDGAIGEVLLVDNASSDGSLALVRTRFPSVRIVQMERNDGPAPARNAGMRAARHRWVLALDNDAVLLPDVLDKLARAVAGRSDVVIAQPRSVFASEPGRVHYDGGALHYPGLIALRNFYVPLERAHGAGVVDVDCAVAVALLVDRDALLAISGYDESMFILFEDLDLSFRLRAQGYAILSVEDAIVLHKGGTPGLSFRDGPSYPGSRVFFHSRNRWIYLAKCYRARTLFVALPGIVAYELVWLVFALSQGALGPWLRGKHAFWKLRKQVRAARAAFQAVRRVSDRELLVAGPLTITPALESSRPKRLFIGALDCVLSIWWKLVRGLAG